MTDLPIQKIWQASYEDFCNSGRFQSDVQRRASRSILLCKTGRLGVTVLRCDDCGRVVCRNHSCRNRNCPNCQAVRKEQWTDSRRAEVIDAPYFHVVFTLPHELNPLFYRNQKLLYGLLHKCCAETLLELSANPKHLGATPGIVQVLHTWNQTLDYHVHMHCIVSGGGLTKDGRLRLSKRKFFIPVFVLRDKFRGKFLHFLQQLHEDEKIVVAREITEKAGGWDAFRDSLYKKDWCPYIKETFNGFGNAMEYLGRYTHKIAISNGRITSVTDTHVTFTARGRKPGEARRAVTLEHAEFIRRFLMHVLPDGFQKIRYYGFLNNRMKTKNLRLIFKLQGKQRFRRRFEDMSVPELLMAVWKIDVHLCPCCGRRSVRTVARYRPAAP